MGPHARWPTLPLWLRIAFDVARLRVRRCVQAYNNYPWLDPAISTDSEGPDEKRALLGEVFGLTQEEIKTKRVYIEPPFNVNYGTNVTFVGSFFANFDLIILDDAPIIIGNGVICGPRVGIYAATHSTNVDERTYGYNRAYPIEIGDDRWIGAGAIINSPSKLGKGCVVAAGAVVKGTFPDYTLIGGIPAKVIKQVEKPTGAYDPSEHGRL